MALTLQWALGIKGQQREWQGLLGKTVYQLSSPVHWAAGCPFSVCLWPLGRETLRMWAADPGLEWVHKTLPHHLGNRLRQGFSLSFVRVSQ